MEFRFKANAHVQGPEHIRSINVIHSINGVSSENLFLEVCQRQANNQFKLIGIISGSKVGIGALSLCRFEDLPVYGKPSAYRFVATKGNVDTLYELFVGDSIKQEGNHSAIYHTVEDAVIVFSALIKETDHKNAYIIGYSVDPLKNVYYQLTHEV